MTARRAALAAALCAALVAPASARTVSVHDTPGLAAALAGAKAGDDIVLDDGTYPIASKLHASAAGTAKAPVTVRAAHRWKAELRSTAVIAFEVNGPYWTFRDLDVRGVCANDSDCEHAFHVTGAAEGFRLEGNRLVDFNAQVKVNANEAHVMPVRGVVDGNEIFDSRARKTGNPVTPLNIDNGSGWVVRGNLIYDFHKAGGNEVSYGAFVKGGAVAPVFERNVVVCSRFEVAGGTRIGLSFGGGGMGPALCAPHWNESVPCDPEVSGGVIRNNIVANCSDVGIYLNKASATQVLFNTLVRTRGIEFRFPGSTGEAKGNLMASGVRGRDGGTFTDGGNMTRMLSYQLEEWYQDPNAGDFRLKGEPPPVIGKGGTDARVSDDFCGRIRTPPLDMGALQSSLGDCPTLP